MKKKKQLLIIFVIIVILLVSTIIFISQYEYKGRNVKKVEKGCTYIVAATGEELKEGTKLPKPANGDIYKTKDYQYRYIEDYYDRKSGLKDVFWYASDYDDNIRGLSQYNKEYKIENPLEGLSGWEHSTINKTKEKYEDIAGSIASEPIVQVSFEDCSKMKKSPNLPKNVVIMRRTYLGCDNLIKAPKMPKGVKLLWGTYSGCDNLIEAPQIPKGVISMNAMFVGCDKLKEMPNIPDSVIFMSSSFKNCTGIKNAKKLPSNVIDISSLFEGCTNLTTAPDIPDGVIDMGCTFYNCTNLKTVKRIPSSVITFTWTFRNCTSLTGIIEIETQTDFMWMCFSGVDFEKQNLELHGKKENIEYLLSTAYQ